MQPDVSRLLMRWSEGDDRAVEKLLPIVYSDLRLLRRSALRCQGPGSILQPTVQVQEACELEPGRFPTAHPGAKP